MQKSQGMDILKDNFKTLVIEGLKADSKTKRSLHEEMSPDQPEA